MRLPGMGEGAAGLDGEGAQSVGREARAAANFSALPHLETLVQSEQQGESLQAARV